MDKIFRVPKYHDITNQTILSDCVLTLRHHGKSIEITHGPKNVRLHLFQAAEMEMVLPGIRSGLFSIWARKFGEPKMIHILLDICPDPDARNVANTIAHWNKWEKLGTLMGSRDEKEDLMNKFSQSVIITKEPEVVHAPKDKAIAPSPASVSSLSESFSPQADRDREPSGTSSRSDTLVADSSSGDHELIVALFDGVNGSQLSPSQEAVVATDQRSTQLPQTPRSQKRKACDDGETIYEPFLQEFEEFEANLVLTREHCVSGIAQLDQIILSNKKRRHELVAQKEQMESTTSLKTRLSCLENEIATLETRHKETSASLEQNTAEVKKLRGKCKRRQSEIDKLIETKQEMITKLESQEANADKVTAAFKAEKEDLQKLVRVSEEHQADLKSENGALKSLASMCMSAIDVDEYCRKVKAGSTPRAAFVMSIPEDK